MKILAQNSANNHHHHHHIVLVARISLTLSRHSSLSFITLGNSSGQHPVSSHSCWMYVHAGRPAFAWPCVGVHKSTSLMRSSLLLQQCPAVSCMYSWCLVGCCRQKKKKKIYVQANNNVFNYKLIELPLKGKKIDIIFHYQNIPIVFLLFSYHWISFKIFFHTHMLIIVN